jgi:hypothetical protein
MMNVEQITDQRHSPNRHFITRKGAQDFVQLRQHFLNLKLEFDTNTAAFVDELSPRLAITYLLCLKEF